MSACWEGNSHEMVLIGSIAAMGWQRRVEIVSERGTDDERDGGRWESTAVEERLGGEGTARMSGKTR